MLFTLTHTVSHATDAVSASVTVDNGIYSYLLIGFDESEENTDALVIMSYNSTTNGLGVIQIPRDTYYKSKNSAKINIKWIASEDIKTLNDVKNEKLSEKIKINTLKVLTISGN